MIAVAEQQPARQLVKGSVLEWEHLKPDTARSQNRGVRHSAQGQDRAESGHAVYLSRQEMVAGSDFGGRG